MTKVKKIHAVARTPEQARHLYFLNPFIALQLSISLVWQKYVLVSLCSLLPYIYSIPRSVNTYQKVSGFFLWPCSQHNSQIKKLATSRKV